MKRYCKRADIYNLDTATAAVLKCLAKARTRRRCDTIKLFSRVGGLSYEDARLLLRWRGAEYERIARLVAEKLLGEYRSGRLKLRVVRLKYVPDGSSGKVRAVAMIPVWQLMLDHIACAALSDVLRRIGSNQYSGMPGRGAVAAVQKISRWLRDSSIKYAAQLDVAKCYQSIDRGRLMEWLSRRVKNAPLLRLVADLIATSPTPGLGIGSYLSQSLAMLYLSEIYHDVTENAARVRHCRNGERKRVRLVRRVIFYMDDIFLFGTSAKDMHRACRRIVNIAAGLGLTIKPTWRVLRIKEADGSGQILDAMGFKISRQVVTVRRRVFLRARRAAIRAWQRLRHAERLSLMQARHIISYGGYFTHSNSGHFSRKYHFPAVVKAAKLTISKHDKKHANE